MAKHNVYFELPARELGKVDANFDIYQNNTKLGTITISKGGLEYYAASKKKPIKIGWTKFDKIMVSLKGGDKNAAERVRPTASNSGLS
jgi:hypothetical protein